MENNNEKKTGRIIFFAALLSVYAVITLALGVLFEYNTIRVSKGETILATIEQAYKYNNANINAKIQQALDGLQIIEEN